MATDLPRLSNINNIITRFDMTSKEHLELNTINIAYMSKPKT